MRRLLTIVALFSPLAAAAVPVIQTADPLPEADAGASYSVPLIATNSPASWTITAGTLSGSGLTLNPGNGVISGGAPVAGLYHVTLQASNTDGPSQAVPFTLAVFPTPLSTHVGTNWTIGDARAVYPSLTSDQAGRLNGRPLVSMAFFGNSFSCGDTITLAAGARYITYLNDSRATFGLDLPRSFRLHAQSCSAGQITSIVSAKLSSITGFSHATWMSLSVSQKSAYLANMAQIIGPPLDPSSDGAVIFYDTPNNYYFGGIAVLTPAVALPSGNSSTCAPNCWNRVAWGSSNNSDDNLTPGIFGNNLTFDRGYVGSQEGFTYGLTQDWYRADGNAQGDNNTWTMHFHSNTIAMSWESDSSLIQNSILDAGGFDPTPDDYEFTVDSATNSRPAKIHSTGIAAALGLTYSPSCYPDGTGAPPRIVDCTCYNNGGTLAAVFTGARGGWGTTATDGSGIGKLNGAKQLVAALSGGVLDPDSAYVFEGWAAEGSCRNLPIDSTSWGALSGTVMGKSVEATHRTVIYPFLTETGAQSVQVENNFLVSHGDAVFLGGGIQRTNNRGDVLSGSTWNNLVLDLTTHTGAVAPNVGDWLNYSTALHPRQSPNCWYSANTGQRCTSGVNAVGIVTGVSGPSNHLTVSLTANNVGFAATDPALTPDITASCGSTAHCIPARWPGQNIQYFLFRHNTILTGPIIQGKPFFEIKSCVSCLITGNLFYGTARGQYFMTPHDQGESPWVNASNTEFSYNLSGDIVFGQGSQASFVAVGQDSEASTAPSIGPRYMYNLMPEFNTAVDHVTQYMWTDSQGSTNSLFTHNTALPASGGIDYKFYSGNDLCTHNPAGSTYMTSSGQRITGNIAGWGYGPGASFVCDTDFPGNITRNVIYNDSGGSVPGWVASQNNSVTSALTAIGFTGTCNFANWANCGLSSSSPYKGAMPDGSDPGTDVVAVQDRLNAWSERAGILAWSQSQATIINNPSAWDVSNPTIARVQFTSLDPSPNANCSFHIYTNLARTLEHPDTAGGNSACNRAGNSIYGTAVTLVLGGHSPLAPGATYAYSISNGVDPACVSDSSHNCNRVMVGSFTTSGSAPANQSRLTNTRVTGVKMR